MISDKNITKNVIKISEKLVAFMLVIDFASIYTHSSDELSVIINSATIFSLLFLSFVSFFLLLKFKLLDNTAILFMLLYYLIFLLPFIIFNNQRFNIGLSFVLQFAIIPLLFFYFDLCVKIDRKWIMLEQINCFIKVISIISIFCWLLFSVFKVMSPTNFVITTWGPLRYIPGYFNIYFETQPISILDLSLVRNTAIFTEGPMYAFILSISLLSNTFLLKKRLLKSKWIILAMITTFTTTSIMVLTFVIFFYISKNRFKKYSTTKILTNLVLFLTSLAIITIALYYKVNNGSSVSIRADDIHAALLDWSRYPIFGNGIGNFNSLIQNMNMSRIDFSDPNTIGFSSGLFQVLALGGLYLVSFYILPFILFIKKSHDVSYYLFSLSLIVLFIFSIVSYEWLFLTIIIMLYAYSFEGNNDDKSISSW